MAHTNPYWLGGEQRGRSGGISFALGNYMRV